MRAQDEANSQERIRTVANYVPELLREVGLDEWIAQQGGIVSA